jgi:hypothetical protein
MVDRRLAARLDAWYMDAFEGDSDDHKAVALLLLTALVGLQRGVLPALARRAWELLETCEPPDPILVPGGYTPKAVGSDGAATRPGRAISDHVFRLMVRRYELQEVRYKIRRRRDEIRRLREHYRP